MDVARNEVQPWYSASKQHYLLSEVLPVSDTHSSEAIAESEPYPLSDI